jgi:hypothetical protein
MTSSTDFQDLLTKPLEKLGALYKLSSNAVNCCYAHELYNLADVLGYFKTYNSFLNLKRASVKVNKELVPHELIK